MIFKQEILAAIGDLDKDLFALEKKIADMSTRLRVLELKNKKPAAKTEKPKRGAGRPKKNS